MIIDALIHPTHRPVIQLPALSNIVTGGTAYLSRSGQSVAVTLHGPRNPRDPDAYPIPTKRVYIPVERLQGATEPKHIANHATHHAQAWLADMRADYWYAFVVLACRPMRARCRPLLHAIAMACRKEFGDRYWRHQGGQDMLARELRLMGIKMPPPPSIIEYAPLVGLTGETA